MVLPFSSTQNNCDRVTLISNSLSILRVVEKTLANTISARRRLSYLMKFYFHLLSDPDGCRIPVKF